MSIKKIDLDDVKTAPDALVFAGRLRGSSCRSYFSVDALDQNADVKVQIHVPKETLAITTSFLLSFLGPSIQKAGSEAAFDEKYVFDCPEYIRPSIREGIERALRPAGSNAIASALR